jgi:prespore-specific regulator
MYMTATRQDAWSEDDDLLLAEVILRHIREGSTQLAAFEEVGYKLGRTPAACGFRWNSTVRKKYESSIQIAKAQRQQLKAKGKKRYHTGVEEDSARIKDLQGASNTELSAETVGGKPVSKGTSQHKESEDILTFDDVIRFMRLVGWGGRTRAGGAATRRQWRSWPKLKMLFARS